MRSVVGGLTLALMAVTPAAAQEGSETRVQTEPCRDGRVVSIGESCSEAPVWPGPYIVFFGWGGTKIDDDAREIIDSAAKAYREGPSDMRLVLTGHSDRSGPARVNERISRQRAQIVRDELVGLGVPANRVAIVAAGEDESLIGTEDDVREAQNRRVEIIYEAARILGD